MKTTPLLLIILISLTACTNNPNPFSDLRYAEFATMLPATYEGIWAGEIEFGDETYNIIASGRIILHATVVDGEVDADVSSLTINGHFEIDGEDKSNGQLATEGASAYNDVSGNVHLKSTLYGAQPPPNGPPPIDCVTQPGSSTLTCHWGNGEVTLNLVSDDGSGLLVDY